MVVTLDMLDKETLVHILTEPKNAITKQYIKLFELDGVSLEFTPEALDLIAARSQERKTGARGLRAIMESIMMDIMFQIPSDETIGRCIITKETVEGTEGPTIIKRDEEVPVVPQKEERPRRFFGKSNEIA